MSLKDRAMDRCCWNSKWQCSVTVCCGDLMALSGGGARWARGASKGDFSCWVGLVVRAAIQADRTLDFCGFCDGDRDVVDLNILQTAKE